MRAATARAGGNDLALFGNVLSESGNVLIIDLGYSLFAEFAYLSFKRAAYFFGFVVAAGILCGGYSRDSTVALGGGDIENPIDAGETG